MDALEDHILAQTLDNLALLKSIGSIGQDNYESILAHLPSTTETATTTATSATSLAKDALRSPSGQRAISSAIQSRVGGHGATANVLGRAANNSQVQNAALTGARHAALAPPPPPARNQPPTSAAPPPLAAVTPSAKDYTPPSGLVSGKGFGRTVGGGVLDGLRKSGDDSRLGLKPTTAAAATTTTPPRRVGGPGIAGIGAGGLPPPKRFGQAVPPEPEPQPAPAPGPAPTSEVPSGGLGTCEASYDYDGSDPADLSFTEGQLIQVLEHVNEDWWRGSLNGREGIFPANYVRMI